MTGAQIAENGASTRILFAAPVMQPRRKPRCIRSLSFVRWSGAVHGKGHQETPTICPFRVLRLSGGSSRWRNWSSYCSDKTSAAESDRSGGAGKTRLSIAIGSAIADRFTAGVQLSVWRRSRGPTRRHSSGRRARNSAGRRPHHPTTHRRSFKKLRTFLLLLDNFEQVISAATVVAEMLEACPSLKIVVTSRSCLHIYGEQEFP